MCIQTRIQKAIAEKAALDARIAKLEKLEAATAPVKKMLGELLADYSQEVPEELPGIWEEILAIGQKFNLSVQPLAAELAQVQQEPTTRKSAIREELENLYEEALTENTESETSVSAELEYLEKLKTAPEPEETTGTVDGILESKGFFRPDNFLGTYSSDDRHETYRGWDIYYSLPNGGVVSIGLDNYEYKQAWDASTEYIQEIDATFPESLADYDEIVDWTRALIDRIENLEVPGQLALESPEPESETVLTGDDDEVPELGDNKEIESKPTKLQKLLKDTNNYIFEKLGARVKVDSEFITDNHGEEPEEVEEALFTVTDLDGGKVEHYYHSAEDLTDYKPIVGWNALANLVNTAESYAKKWAKEQSLGSVILGNVIRSQNSEVPIAESTNAEPAKETETVQPEATSHNFLDFSINTMGVQVQVYPQYAGENNLMGATFRFLSLEEKGVDGKPKVVCSKSLLAAELGDRNYKLVAIDLLQNWQDKETARLERIANPHKKPEDDFVELVKLTSAVGYLKRKDNGEILAGYLAFANRDSAGQKTETLAKPRAKKWAEYLSGAAYEHFNWKVEGPRKIERMVAEPGTPQQFAYEIKITGSLAIERIQKLAEYNFSLLPEQIGVPLPTLTSTSQTQNLTSKVYRVRVNSFELAHGTEEEMRSRFEEELEILGGSQMSVSLLAGFKEIESYKVGDFNFVRVGDFDSDNPEYEVQHLPTQKSFKVYKRLGVSPQVTGWTNTVYPYSEGFSKREAAAADAVRRLLKAESAG